MRNKRRLVRRRRRLRRLATAFLLFHVATMVIAPASVDPTSPMWLAAWNVVRPYAQVIYLDQGWNFFSPEPGASTLIAYEATMPNGDVIQERIPNKQIWPRLLYHRHFMLTSYMGFFEDDYQVRLCEGYAQHIKRKYHAEDVKLTMLVHQLPTMEHIAGGGDLQHEDLWEEYSLEEVELESPTRLGETDAGERVSTDNGESLTPRNTGS